MENETDIEEQSASGGEQEKRPGEEAYSVTWGRHTRGSYRPPPCL